MLSLDRLNKWVVAGESIDEAQLVLHHSLMNERVPPSLADHQIGPLNDNDRHEESRVTGVLERLSLRICLQQNTFS